MIKLYRYRPLSEWLFKELFYQELYFASYDELNDPLDLSARIDFSAKKENDIEFLLYFLIKKSIVLSMIEEKSEENKDKVMKVRKLIALSNNKELIEAFTKSIYEEVSKMQDTSEFTPFDDIERVIIRVANKQNIDFPIDFALFHQELNRLTKVFIENSHALCFSETNEDFLMWSHYASKHSGVCLEFSLLHRGLFPYEMQLRRGPNKIEYEKKVSVQNIETYLFWDRVHKVEYQSEQPYINFFEFAEVFENEGDCDLMGLSKSRWHGYAAELEISFATKTLSWAYEKEWRAIEITFGNPAHQEEKIRHYPIEALSAIYFGFRTPVSVKRRIADIFRHKLVDIQFFESKLYNGKELSFEEWNDEEE